MNEKAQKLRQINNILSIRERFKYCPIDKSSLTSECQFCEACDKFKKYLLEELDVKMLNGRFTYGPSNSGKWIRTQEDIDKAAKKSKERRQFRINRITKLIDSKTGYFNAKQLATELNENEGFIAILLRALRKKNIIKRVVLSRYNYKFIKL